MMEPLTEKIEISIQLVDLDTTSTNTRFIRSTNKSKIINLKS